MPALWFSISKHRSVKRVPIEHCYDVQNEKLPVEPINPDGNKSVSLDPNSVIIHYIRGGEMQIKSKLLPLNRYDKLDIWFLASNDANGAAARGLTRTLQREVPNWNIHLVFFPTETPTELRISALPFINKGALTEDEIIVDGGGERFAPRFVEFPTIERTSINSKIEFSADKAYLLLGGVGSLGARIALWMYEVRRRIITMLSSETHSHPFISMVPTFDINFAERITIKVTSRYINKTHLILPTGVFRSFCPSRELQ